ncbi:MAG: 16S rRNA (cytosine(1402)-N(4))-methyltransferase RsmH [Alphaproteobacteria bacterium]
MKHIPVLLQPVLDELGDIKGKRILDATFGAGGYSRAFLERGANVVAFDRDTTVLQDVNKIIAEYPNQFTFIQKTFSNISNLTDTFDAIVFDLGISSMQIDNPERGFSFRADAPLDMRMSGDGISAVDLIKNSSVQELANILKKYGDVNKANVIAKAIHDTQPQTTFELKNLIYNPRDVAPVFQALRIAVNDELGEIERALYSVPKLLNQNGKCIVVTFHSIEDRLVKNILKEFTTPVGNPKLPTIKAPDFVLLKPQTPNEQELEYNPRARSAHLRGVLKNHIDPNDKFNVN